MAAGISNSTFNEEYEIDIVSSDAKIQNENSTEEKKESSESPGFLEKWKNQFNIYMTDKEKLFKSCGLVLLNILIFTYMTFASIHWYKNISANDCDLDWCNGFGMFILIVVIIYSYVFYHTVIKKLVRLLSQNIISSFKILDKFSPKAKYVAKFIYINI
ncbi:uncharacterized protein LOC117181217 [Belonocnema kinseyi]|uniref:uncharacterized protein LOC117181217 n=1 Tax=Belonocnema kinseyi TaxID=2817044 RepID=UPI00143DAAA1|nr:uncharacterized protein LOC117181217 [Belonocnema kinseyi]